MSFASTLLEHRSGVDVARPARTATAEPGRPPRRVDPAVVSAARELDVEVAQLLRVRRGELAEPAEWRRPAHRLRVAAILAQLHPIRSRAALASSWSREASRGPEVGLAYAMAAIAIDRLAATARARRRPKVRMGPIVSRG